MRIALTGLVVVWVCAGCAPDLDLDLDFGCTGPDCPIETGPRLSLYGPERIASHGTAYFAVTKDAIPQELEFSLENLAVESEDARTVAVRAGDAGVAAVSVTAGGYADAADVTVADVHRVDIVPVEIPYLFATSRGFAVWSGSMVDARVRITDTDGNILVDDGTRVRADGVAVDSNWTSGTHVAQAMSSTGAIAFAPADDETTVEAVTGSGHSTEVRVRQVDTLTDLVVFSIDSSEPSQVCFAALNGDDPVIGLEWSFSAGSYSPSNGCAHLEGGRVTVRAGDIEREFYLDLDLDPAAASAPYAN